MICGLINGVYIVKESAVRGIVWSGWQEIVLAGGNGSG